MARRQKPITVVVSHRAILLRLRRKLKTQGLILRHDRAGGRWLVANPKRGVIVEHGTSLEALARKWQALLPWEYTAE
jgi:hypothetical protein